MTIVVDRELIECPRCGTPHCEQTTADISCPNCLFYEPMEPIQSVTQIRGRPSGTPTDAVAPDTEKQSDAETLGEFIEQVPADIGNWSLSLNHERILKMNAVKNSESQAKQVTIYDVFTAEEAKNGRTYWHSIGVAFPLSNGSNGLSLKLHMFPNLRIVVKESIRAVGAAKANREEMREEDTPF